MKKYFDHLMNKLPASPRGYGDESLMIYALQEKIAMLDQFLKALQASVPEPQSDLVALRASLVWLVQYYKGSNATEEEHTIYSEYAWNHLAKLDSEIEEDSVN